jgi:hypothetical protein
LLIHLGNILAHIASVTRARLNDLTAPAKEAKSFDAWFFAQPKKVQEKMRENGVLPYREMTQSRHVFNIDANHPSWSSDTDKTRNMQMGEIQARTEVDTFISRDHVGVMLKAFMDAIAHSDSMAFRRHVELCRWALSLPGCMSSRLIGKMYGRSHFWMRARAKEIQRAVNSDACGMFPHVNARRGKNKAPSPPPPGTPKR